MFSNPDLRIMQGMVAETGTTGRRSRLNNLNPEQLCLFVFALENDPTDRFKFEDEI